MPAQRFDFIGSIPGVGAGTSIAPTVGMSFNLNADGTSTDELQSSGTALEVYAIFQWWYPSNMRH